MASLVLGIAGAAALGPAGLGWSGMLGMSGAQIGFMAGSMLGSSLTKLPDVQGPRMSDLKVQASTYGAMISIDYGTTRHTGQVMWSSDLIETENEESSGGLGKGGPSQSVSTYTYSVNCAVAVCEGEISGIRKIWANGNLIYDQSDTNTGPTGQSGNIRVYTGSETQVADSLLEAYLGAGNVPAHRGLAYVVFENLQLEKYGNRIPNFSFEIVADGAVVTPSHQMITTQTVLHMIPHPFIKGIYLATSRDDGGAAPNIYLHIIDAIGKTSQRIAIDVDQADWVSGYITYVEYGTDPVTGLPLPINEIWVNTSRHDYAATNEVAVAFDAASMTLKRRIIPSTNIGINYTGKCIYDKANSEVLFLTTGSTIGDGCRYIDPYTMEWDGAVFNGPSDILVDWYVGNAAVGENSICAVNYYNYAVFFSGGAVNAQLTGVSAPHYAFMAYDSTRNRYACFSRNVSTQAVFRTFKDDITFAMEDIQTTNTGLDDGWVLTYWPIADKYIFRSGDNIKILNAETFQIEQSLTQDINAAELHDNFEIDGLPEYFIGYANAAPTSGAALVPLTDRLSANTVTLSSIVTDICERVGLAAGDIDVTGLTDEVEGYTIAQQMTARAAIDGLQAAFYFDAVESD